MGLRLHAHTCYRRLTTNGPAFQRPLMRHSIFLAGAATCPIGVGFPRWPDLLQNFMTDRGYEMLFPGITLCRRQGDNSTVFADEREVAASISASDST